MPVDVYRRHSQCIIVLESTKTRPIRGNVGPSVPGAVPSALRNFDAGDSDHTLAAASGNHDRVVVPSPAGDDMGGAEE